ncbi:MAG TPA: LacI family DNA-binding transcriptional regulator [Vicinamibacteria bacterium]|nr:LacI family DNA-binding transcriptional regulator [Vicinamibacteria bacterium]
MPKEPESIGTPVTIEDIARYAGVSVSTVSRVLNKTVPVARAKREAVLRGVEALSYRPNLFAQELARGRSLAVGVLPQGIWNPFYSRLLKGVEQGLRGTAFHPVFASGEQPVEEAEAFERLLDNRVEAIILMGGQIPDEKLVLLAQRVPIVAIGRNLRGLEHRCVRVENAEGGYQATRHLIDLGHTRIVHITGLAWHSDAVARRQGYERALAEAGLPFDPALVVEGDWEEQSGLSSVERLLARGVHFTAIFCGNDQIAFGAALALFRRGLAVGRDVSIVGFDDQPSAAFSCPPLTTVRQPAVDMGMAAARAIVEELRGRGFVQPVFRTELVLRASTGPPPALAARRVARNSARSPRRSSPQ